MTIYTISGPGVTSSGITLSSGDLLTVVSGTAVATLIESGGQESDFGVDSSAVVNGGTQNVSFNGEAFGAQVINGGTQHVENGGVAFSTWIGNGGTQDLENNFSTGVDAIGASVGSGGVQVLFNGGASATTVFSGGIQRLNGGFALATIVSSGGEEMVAQGVASSTVIVGGGWEIITRGLTGSAGVAINPLVSSGGVMIVMPTGTISGGEISNGGTLLVFPGAVSAGVIADSGSDIIQGGGVVLLSGMGTAHPLIATPPAGGSASGDVIASGATEYVFQGGISVDPLIQAGGTLLVSAGGTVVDPSASIGADIAVAGTLSGGTISGGAIPLGIPVGTDVESGGLAIGTTVEGDPFFSVQGVVSAIVLSNSELQIGGIAGLSTVSGHAYGVRVENGGVLHDEAGDSIGSVIGSDGLEQDESSATGAIVNPGGTLVVGFSQQLDGLGLPISVGQAVSPSINSGGELVFRGTAVTGFNNGFPTVSWLSGEATGVQVASGGMLDFPDLPNATFTMGPNGSVPGDTILTVNGGVQTIDMVGDYSGLAFHASQDSSSGTLLTLEAGIGCFAVGTAIQTSDGPRLVETIRVGDHVVCLNGSSQPVVWVGRRVVDCARHPRPEAVWPVRVTRGGLGANVPSCDLYLSPDHAILVDGALVPVGRLVNGTSIMQVERSAVTYFHIELPSHSVLFAEGLPVESYLNIGDRINFDDDPVIRLYPAFGTKPRASIAWYWESEGAAPLVTGGPDLQRARNHIANLRVASTGQTERHGSHDVVRDGPRRSVSGPSRGRG